MNYTQRDIDEAKAFILKRIEAEISMQSHLDEALMWAAKEIAEISYRYKMSASMFRFSANKRLQSEVDSVIEKLREMIYEYTETLSVAVSKEDKEDIIAWMNEEEYGHTLKERINIYTNRFKFEIESFVAAGILASLTVGELTGVIRNNLSMPYNNSLFRKAVSKGGMSASRIKTGGISYGNGHSNSARNLLNTLTRNTISQAWMQMYGSSAYKNGATGFYSFRGSIYPCAYCDDMVGYHPIEEYRGGWHPNCRCYFVFVYK